MNALAVYYVNQHLQELRDEAERHRSVRADGPSLRQRIASAVSDARHNLAIPQDNRGTILPKLSD